MANELGLQHELEHWDLAFYRERRAYFECALPGEAAKIRALYQRVRLRPFPADGRVLEIGAGPFSVVDYWGRGELHALDPLATRYAEKGFGEFQDSAVRRSAGVGEKLPHADGYFDLILIRNALDHTDDPLAVLREARRALRIDGALYVLTYLYSGRASLAYRAINALTQRYATEPWAFTWNRLMRLFAGAGLEPVFPVAERRPPPESEQSDSRIKRLLKRMCDFRHDTYFYTLAVPAGTPHGGRHWPAMFPQPPAAGV